MWILGALEASFWRAVALDGLRTPAKTTFPRFEMILTSSKPMPRFAPLMNQACDISLS